MQDALSLFERARALDPTDPVIALNLGRTYLAVQRLDDAIRTLQSAALLEPPSFFAYLNLSRAYLRRGDLVQSRAALTRAKTLKEDPWFWSQMEQQLSQAEQRRS
jgi:predicted Zn-dependent protease